MRAALEPISGFSRFLDRMGGNLGSPRRFRAKPRGSEGREGTGLFTTTRATAAPVSLPCASAPLRETPSVSVTVAPYGSNGRLPFHRTEGFRAKPRGSEGTGLFTTTRATAATISLPCASAPLREKIPTPTARHHLRDPPAETPGRRENHPRQRPPPCASAPLREPGPLPSPRRCVAAGKPPVRVAAGIHPAERDNGGRPVGLTFAPEASSRSCGSQLLRAPIANLRIPCAVTASRTPRHPFKLPRPLTGRTEERESGQVHDAMPRSGAVESQRFWARKRFVKWIDLTPLPPPRFHSHGHG